jgi:hypothetical protein
MVPFLRPLLPAALSLLATVVTAAEDHAVVVLGDGGWIPALAATGITAETVPDLPALIRRCEQDPPPRFVVATAADSDSRLALVCQAMAGLAPSPWIAVGPDGRRLLNGSGTPSEAILVVACPADAATVAAIVRR